MAPCIFCFKSSPEVVFSKEHVIPDSLGGMLTLSNYVCSNCNSKFGSEVDHEILRNPEILSAFDSLELPFDRQKLINHNYKIKLEFEGIELNGKAKRKGFISHPQSLPDGSMLYDEEEYKGPLLKMLCRDQDLEKTRLTIEQIEAEYLKLTTAYEQAPVGEEIENQSLSVKLIKRSGPVSVSLEPKGPGNVSLLIAKIAYEFGFLVGFSEFLSSENVAKPLRKLLETRQFPPGFRVFKIDTESTDYAPVHFIRFECYDELTRITVGFFGKIVYTLIAPPFENKVLTQIAVTYDCPEVVGVEYQQNMEKGSIGFWALLRKKDVIYVGP